MATYRITTYTPEIDKAGTNAHVYITLFGALGNSGERELDNQDQNFEQGKMDVFSITSQELGNLQRIRIRHDGRDSNPGWFLDKIVVHNEDTDREWTFPCNRWLASDEDDGLIDRMLDAS